MDQHRSRTTRRRWFAGWGSLPRRGGRDDPADQGTAFGLEMSLLPGQFDTETGALTQPPARPAAARWWWPRRRAT